MAGWLAVCLTNAGIVSKRLNISENFYGNLVAPSFRFFCPLCRYPRPRGTPSMGR